MNLNPERTMADLEAWVGRGAEQFQDRRRNVDEHRRAIVQSRLLPRHPDDHRHFHDFVEQGAGVRGETVLGEGFAVVTADDDQRDQPKFQGGDDQCGNCQARKCRDAALEGRRSLRPWGRRAVNSFVLGTLALGHGGRISQHVKKNLMRKVCRRLPI